METKDCNECGGSGSIFNPEGATACPVCQPVVREGEVDPEGFKIELGAIKDPMGKEVEPAAVILRVSNDGSAIQLRSLSQLQLSTTTSTNWARQQEQKYSWPRNVGLVYAAVLVLVDCCARLQASAMMHATLGERLAKQVEALEHRLRSAADRIAALERRGRGKKKVKIGKKASPKGRRKK